MPVTAVAGALIGGGTLSATVVPIEQYVRTHFREADRKVCKDLGVVPERGAAAMIERWGHTFTDERDHRAGPDAKAQGKGQVSRQLKAETLGRHPRKANK